MHDAGRSLAALVCVASLGASACSACGKSPSGGTNVGPSAPSAPGVSRTSLPPDAGVVAVRDLAMWTSAREGLTEDLASLAAHEGAAGLIEATAEPELRLTAIGAMGYARGWAQVPFLAGAAAGKNDDEAKAALEALVELAARPRHSEDVEDEDELGEGCDKLGAFARDTRAPRERRIVTIRALRMMPCPKQDLPVDLDAR